MSRSSKEDARISSGTIFQQRVATLDAVTIDLPAEELVEIRDLWIEIHHRPGRSLVTAIEILSPTNKAGEGYWDYLSKRRKMIHQNVHLVELDLLIRGRRLPMERYVAPGGSLRVRLAGRAAGRSPRSTPGLCASHCRRFPFLSCRPILMSSSICRPSSPSATSGADMLASLTIPPRLTCHWPRPTAPGPKSLSSRHEPERLLDTELPDLHTVLSKRRVCSFHVGEASPRA